MTTRNALKSYVRRTILCAATEYSPSGKRRTAESTRSACIDAVRGTDTGWWQDLIYNDDCSRLARRYRRDISTALAEYRGATGEDYVYRTGRLEVRASEICGALLVLPAAVHEDWGAYGVATIGLRFAVEWYANEVARDLVPDF